MCTLYKFWEQLNEFNAASGRTEDKLENNSIKHLNRSPDRVTLCCTNTNPNLCIWHRSTVAAAAAKYKHAGSHQHRKRVHEWRQALRPRPVFARIGCVWLAKIPKFKYKRHVASYSAVISDLFMLWGHKFLFLFLFHCPACMDGSFGFTFHAFRRKFPQSRELIRCAPIFIDTRG